MSTTQTIPGAIAPVLTGPPLADYLDACPAILVVEDEAFVRHVLCDVLEDQGYRVLRARTAAEAWTAFHQNHEKINLLVTDVVLPGKNGCELADELKAACSELRVIFISGYPENTILQGSITSSDFYLRKPFSVQMLVGKVREALADRMPLKV